MSSKTANPGKIELVVIGASAGGVEALRSVLPTLPPKPAIVVVQHIPPQEKSLLPSIFSSLAGFPVSEPEDKEPVLPGRLYFAPPGYHLLLESDHTFALSMDDLVNFSRPSIDVLFQSAAECCGDKVLGIILTGANSDGAEGLRAVLNRGGVGVIQNPDTAATPEMPRAALGLCPEASTLTLPEIKALLEKLA